MLSYKSLHSKIEEQETNAIYYLLRKFNLLQETVTLSKVSSVNGKYGIYKYDTGNEKLIISNIELATAYKVTFTIFDSSNNIRKVNVTGKETNGSVNITIPYITSKETLLEKIEVVITYAREIKPISYPYNLTVTGDKDIIQSTESATVTATLTQEDAAVSGKTLSYTVKHGTTTIDSGTITTGSDGTATVVYTGTGVGEVNINVSYGTLLQETYELWDTLFYDNGLDTNYNPNWENYNNLLTVARDNLGTLLTNTSGNNGYWVATRNFLSSFVVEFDIVSVDGATSVAYSSPTSSRIRIDTRATGGDTFKVEYNNNENKVYVNDELVFTNTTLNEQYIGLRLENNATFKYKNFKLYSA